MTNLLLYHKNLERYLNELRILTLTDVTQDQLSSLEQIERIRKKINKSTYKYSNQYTFLFEEKKSRRFSRFIGELFDLNMSPVYIWTKMSNACGLLKVESILKINFGFDYSLNPEGAVNLLTTDMRDEMILDFTEEEDGARILDIELHGDSWPLVKYIMSPELKSIERARIEKEIQLLEKQISFCETRLSNCKFVEYAPRKVVEDKRERLETAQKQLTSLRTKLKDIE